MLRLLFFILAQVLVSPLALLARWTGERGFVAFAETLSIIPGPPGNLLRKAYYHLTLEACGSLVWIGFLSYIRARNVRIGDGVVIARSCVIFPDVTLGDRCFVSTGAKIINGRDQHPLSPGGRRLPHNPGFDSTRSQITIGEDVWIGADAVVMADVGARAQIGARAVVVKPVPAGETVVGNPARAVPKSQAAAAQSANDQAHY